VFGVRFSALGSSWDCDPEGAERREKRELLRYVTEIAAPIDKDDNSDRIRALAETEQGGNDGKRVV